MRAEDHALIVIDIQNDFCPDGALAVAEGDAIIGRVNELMADFPVVVLTQDWHPPNHSSFASNHPGKAAFESIEMPYGAQTLWPDHCIQGSEGAQFHPSLNTVAADIIIRKGFRPAIDSYSAFFENDRTTPTGLDGYLKVRGVRAVTLVGLATDYCVAYSALDAVRLGYHATVLLEACRGINLGGSLARMIEEMRAHGVEVEA